jgi:hypothetical protein
MSNIYPARKTLQAIEQAIVLDQGASFREWQGKVIPHLEDAYRGAEDGFRSHMGASQIGGQCDRQIWYSFRWATKNQFGGQLLRLFNRGHIEEGRFIAMLLAIGVRVYQQDQNGKQFRISGYGGHFGGSGDGVGVGVPDVPPGTPCLLEFKTHNDNSFRELKKLGVRAAKFEHYVQMQTYLRKMGLTCALYMAVNKNNDELYAEIILLDEAAADSYIARAYKIIPLVQAPVKVSKSPGWTTCVFCDHKPVCHLRVAPVRNCRTCAHSVAKEDGQFWCTNEDRQKSMIFGPKEGVSEVGETLALSKARQLTGCSMYNVNPTMTS